MASTWGKVHRPAAGFPGGALTHIAHDLYTEIIGVLPILCVDIAVRNASGQYLLVKRANPPKQGSWWVLGGRVNKGETLEAAVARKLREEAGVSVSDLRPVGYMELPSDDHPFGLGGDYHAVSVVFSGLLRDDQPVKLDAQSSEWRWGAELPDYFQIKTFRGMA